MKSLARNVEYYPLEEFCKQAECGPINVINYNIKKKNLKGVLEQIKICQKSCMAYKLYQYQQGNGVEPAESINS